MKRAIAIFVLMSAAASFAKTQSDPKPELLAMLNNFLVAASHTPPSSEDENIFDKFFADDVLYTRASGAVITKQEIMRSLDEPPSASDPKATYSAEDVTIHEYGDVAIVAFRLVQKTSDGTTKQYRNTGTFLTRNHRWEVVGWQATPIPDQAKTNK